MLKLHPDHDPLANAWPRGQALRLEGVRLVRGEAEVLRGVEATFEPGKSYVIVGASGSGKSTLLRLLNRLEDPEKGRILVGETPVVHLPVRAVRRGVGLVFQNPRPLPGTLLENLAFPFEVVGLPAPARDALAQALEEVGLEADWLSRDAMGLSGGERQRLALVVALLAGPEILALDEPTAGLDPSSARMVADLLERRARADGLRTITVTHHREHAAWLGETAMVLDEGRIIDVGPTAEVLARSDARVWAKSQNENTNESHVEGSPG
jgi:ABC-type multidrug transport system ATPase subunit